MPHFASPPRAATSLLPRPKGFLRVGLLIAAILAVAFVATQFYQHRIAPARLEAAMRQPDWPTDASAASAMRRHITDPRGIVRFFDLDAEANLPTAWSGLQLVAGAGLLGVVGVQARRAGRPFATMWLLLAAGFVLLAIDEMAQIHGGMYLAASGEAQRRARGVLYYSWVVPALAIVGVSGLVFARFLMHLPSRTRWLFAGCGAMYVLSAIGGEMTAGWLKSSGVQRRHLLTSLTVTLEEIGEMVAITFFAASVLDYLRRSGIDLLISEGTGPAAPETEAPIPFPRPGRQAA
jgi:hypothetical protein